jgi:hypothetical protein
MRKKVYFSPPRDGVVLFLQILDGCLVDSATDNDISENLNVGGGYEKVGFVSTI